MTPTYIATIRAAALGESRALRGWAKAGRTPPPCAPVDRWAEWVNARKTNGGSFGEKVAA